MIHPKFPAHFRAKTHLSKEKRLVPFPSAGRGFRMGEKSLWASSNSCRTVNPSPKSDSGN
jgi:hypothetical protein